MLLGVDHPTADIHLEPDASRGVRVRMEPGVRFVRKACITTNTSDRSGRRGDRSRISHATVAGVHLGNQRFPRRGGAAMKRFTQRNRMAPGLLMGLLALVAWLVMAVQPAFPEEGQSASPSQTQMGSNAGGSPPPA